VSKDKPALWLERRENNESCGKINGKRATTDHSNSFYTVSLIILVAG